MKYTFKLDTKPLENALKDIAKNVSGDEIGKAVLGGLFTLEAHAKLNVRKNFKQHTGFLAANWDTQLDQSTNKSAIGHTGPLAVYGRIQELGGVIRSSKGALTFQTDDGQWHTVKAVTIPARPYLRPAADEYKDDIFKTIEVILHDLIEGK